MMRLISISRRLRGRGAADLIHSAGFCPELWFCDLLSCIFRHAREGQIKMKRNSVNMLNTNLGVLLLVGGLGLLATCPGARNAEAAGKKPTSPLERLADSRFPDLSECENNLLRNALVGGVAFCGPSHTLNDRVPDTGTVAKQEYDVRAALIRWLAVDPAAAKFVDPRGFEIHAARIVGELNFSFATVPFPLRFANSRFMAKINLIGCQLVALSLAGSQTLGISAYSAMVRQSLVLNDGFSANGEVNLINANLGGDLEAGNGQFKNPGKIALIGDRLKASSVFLQGVSAEGEVRFLEANIGEFDANGGQFKNPGNVALGADRLKASSVFLQGVSAEGEVRFLGANLSGDLEANNGQFKNPGKIALEAAGLNAASVYLRDGFGAEGEVSFIGANLSGDLDANGQFKNPGNHALSADRLKAVTVFLRDPFDAEGEVRFPGANLSGNLDASGGQFKNPSKVALDATRLETAGYVLFDGLSADGQVILSGCNLKSALFLRNRRSEKPDDFILRLRDSNVWPLFDDEQSWPKQGNLSLDGFVYTMISDGPTDPDARLRWLDRQRQKGSSSFAAQPYEQLARVLREAGDDAGARSILIAMENARWWYVESGLQRVWNFILWGTIGYGYDTWRALYSVAFLVAVGTFVFFWGYKSGVITQTDKDEPKYYRPFNCFVYSLETFLPLVDLQQAKHWAPNPVFNQNCPPVPVGPFWPLSKYQLRFQFGPKFGRRLRCYLWVHIVAGWFYTLMLGAAFTGLVQKG
jgi:hypothetical protein